MGIKHDLIRWGNGKIQHGNGKEGRVCVVLCIGTIVIR